MLTVLVYISCTAASILGAGFQIFTSMNIWNKRALAKKLEFKSSDYWKAERFAIYANLCIQGLVILAMKQLITNYPALENHLIALNAFIGAAGNWAFRKWLGTVKERVNIMAEAKEKEEITIE